MVQVQIICSTSCKYRSFIDTIRYRRRSRRERPCTRELQSSEPYRLCVTEAKGSSSTTQPYSGNAAILDRLDQKIEASESC
ncbi:hypothetical protein CGMCC3_g7871 [Colletotrichum fructicola]|nr:uncharacterized protein CGMCC3_g7871 [Colletotrichum fructicola]KAE9576044.1 hypothetical protein CGMCC3_g7871 [Colletotrichum fructicola]